jgi:hypothetical protein
MTPNATADALEYRREVARRRHDEVLEAERQLSAALHRTETVLSKLRGELDGKRGEREANRALIEKLNRRLSARRMVSRAFADGLVP